MFKFLTKKKFTNSLVPGTVARLLTTGVASTVAATTIATVPAYASTLTWTNGTNDFYSQLGGPGTALPATFNVIFSPDNSDNPPNDGIGSALVSTANGDFVPPFDFSPPNNLVLLQEAVGQFALNEGDTPGVGETFTYELTAPLTFAFENGVIVTWGTGTEFNGAYDNNNGVGFVEASELVQPTVIIPGFGSTTATEDELTFGDIANPDGGGYDAQVATEHVPEPGTVFGMLTIGGLGLLTKRKKQV